MFGYLSVHSHYSLLRGIAKVPDLLARASDSGCDALALTDTHNMYGAIEFYTAAKAAGIRPILGTTLLVRHSDSDPFYPLILLAENEQGYRSILDLITQAHATDGPTPFLVPEQIAPRTDGVIALLPALYNPILQSLAADDPAGAAAFLSAYQTLFGDSLYLGISPQNPTPRGGTPVSLPPETLVSFAEEHSVSLVLLPTVSLISEASAEARSVLLQIQKVSLSHAEEGVFEDPLLFPDREDLERWCRSVCPAALQALSAIIARSTRWDLELGRWVFPRPPVSDSADRQALFREHIDRGYAHRDLEKTPEIEKRVAFEFEVITDRGYTDYFLTVIDLITYMREHDILTTTRGSAAGSMVSYLTGITHVNPIDYHLPFERFLNPFRPSPPDIDLDIADNRRGEVIDYIVDRFGEDKVAQIGTLGTMMARAAVRDTARALGYSYQSGDRIARLIPLGAQGSPMYIDTALETVKDLRALYDSDPTTRHIIDVAKKIEGNSRHLSVHAAGVVISPTAIRQYTPLERDTKGASNRPITQYNMHAVEDAGLIKFDILGLTNLAILSDAVRLVREDRGKDLDVDRLPPDDPATYAMLGKGRTIGVFQMGGSGMTSVLRRMKPTTVHDLAAIIALYRPGPMRNIDEYIDRKQGKKPVTYLHPAMKKFLSNSHGVLVYQDDLLYTAIEIAGYNWEEVDVFRKAVGKKIPELMAEQEKIFKDRAREQSSMTTAQVNALWDLFDPFKGYGFNKAHAMSYAKVAYQTAYVKAHFPAQYMTAHLNAAVGETDTVSELVYEAKRIGLSVLPPGLNESDNLFTTEQGGGSHESIRIGLATIKQVGSAAATAIVSERNARGAYVSLEDFFTRIAPLRVMNRRNVEALIKVGVFDSFERRDTLLANLPLILHCLKDTLDDPGQHILFDSAPSAKLILQPVAESVTKAQELYWEKGLLGVYVSGHPLTLFQRNGLRFSDIKREGRNKRVSTTGVIGALRPHRNKSGERMFFITLEDDSNDTIEAVCFPKETEEHEDLLALHRPVRVRASTSLRNDEVSLRIDSIEDPLPVAAS